MSHVRLPMRTVSKTTQLSRDAQSKHKPAHCFLTFSNTDEPVEMQLNCLYFILLPSSLLHFTLKTTGRKITSIQQASFPRCQYNRHVSLGAFWS
uniref:Uncharacterized protein n=1 Tax=Anguilla anguilla TaxID=7936 RepID=A0A0E9TM35_ANGAN